MILYSCIARGVTVVVEVQNQSYEYEQLSVKVSGLLPHIETSKNSKGSADHDSFVFNVVVESGLTYICASAKEFSKVQAHKYLQYIKKRFTEGSLCFRAQSAGELELNRDFGPVMRQQMSLFSAPGHADDHVTRLQGQVNEVKDIMTTNVEKTMQRGDRLEDLMEKSESLSENAVQFSRNSTRLKRKMWWKNTKMILILVAVAIVIILLIVLMSTNIIPVKSDPADPTPAKPTTTVPSLVRLLAALRQTADTQPPNAAAVPAATGLL